MSINICDSADFERLLKRLATDIVNGAIFYKLHRDLRSSVEEFEPEFNQSPGFWSLTLHAHLDAARIRLLRVYDQHDQALSLRSWLETIRDNLALFGSNAGENLPEVISRGAMRPDPGQLDADLGSVSHSDALVKKLVVLRGNVIAHTSARDVIEELRLEDRFALTYDDLSELVSRATTVFNRYSNLFKRETWESQMVGHDDFRHVLASVRRDLERDRAEFKAKLSRLHTTTPST